MSNRAKHAFGNSENINVALEAGTINAYDIMYLDGATSPKVGWIDKDGNPVVVDPEKAKTLQKVKYEVTHKPDGTIINYRDKEIRVLCPKDTKFALQTSGANADANKYYIGFKAYAPENAVSFKEDIAETIADETMYFFEDNEFAGIDVYGRKYSIVWLPVAAYDTANNVWTYYGVNSTEEKYVGWYYSVEWYNTDGVVIASDTIRVNLSNEDCHSSIEPYYISEAIKAAKAYADEQIEAKVTESSAIEIVEF